MRVHFQVSGGVAFFPGRAVPRTIDVDTLGAAEQQSLRQLIDQAQFFSLPSHIAAARGAADFQTYHITIEDGGRRHSVAVSDPVPLAPLQKLVEAVRSLAR
jgi:hypothetical protein